MQHGRISAVALRARVLGSLALVALVAIPLVGVHNLQSRISDVNPFAGAGFAQGRGGIWQVELAKIVHANPLQILIGYGAPAAYVPVFARGAFSVQSPHNLVLWLLVETGLVGLLAYGAFAISLVRAFARRARELRSTPAGKVASVALSLCVAYFVLDMFILTATSPGNRWYFMLVIAAALRISEADVFGADLTPDPAPAVQT